MGRAGGQLPALVLLLRNRQLCATRAPQRHQWRQQHADRNACFASCGPSDNHVAVADALHKQRGSSDVPSDGSFDGKDMSYTESRDRVYAYPVTVGRLWIIFI